MESSGISPSPLRDYFLSPGYFDGDLFPAAEHGYEATSLPGTAVQVFKHSRTGIIVWSFALDLRQLHVAASHRVLFYYTNAKTFKLLVEGREKCTDRFVQFVVGLGSNFSLGPDASSQPPDRWTSQDEVLINCHWPRQADWEEAHGSIPMPTGSAAIDFIDTPMHTYIKQRFPDGAAYCISFLCDAAGVSNVLTSNTPALLMPAGPNGISHAREAGYNRFRDKEPDWRDIWTVDLWMLDSSRNVQLRSIPPTSKRLQMKRWERHPTDINVGRYLAFIFKAEGRVEEAAQVFRALLKVPKFKEHADFVSHVAEFAALVPSEAEELLRESLIRIDLGKIEVEDAGLHHRSLLALFLQFRGSFQNLKEAEQLHRKVFEAHRVTMGEQHPHTLLDADGLAFTLARLGRLPEAAEMYARILQNAITVFGRKHPDTMCTRNNLACVLQEMGQLQQAERHFRRAMRRSQKILGAHHPHTLCLSNNFALLLKQKGQSDDAFSLHRQLLQQCFTALGELHPQTLASMDSLACVMDDLGDQHGSERLHRQVVEKACVVLGANHPETLRFRNNLACLVHSQGQLIEARQIYADVLDLRKKALGGKHPDTLLSANNLACLLQDLQDLRQAVKCHKEVVAASQEVLGETHPQTLKFSHDLAVALQKFRRRDEAETLQRNVLKMQKEALGGEHPDTVQSQYSLGRLLWSRGQLDEAETMLREVRQVRIQQFGAKHVDTVRSTERLAQLLQQKGETVESEQLQKQLQDTFPERSGMLMPRAKLAAPAPSDALLSEGTGSASAFKPVAVQNEDELSETM